jgi:hypothetical protein
VLTVTVKRDKRPGYTTAADKRELLLVMLAGWTFERHAGKHQRGEYVHTKWFKHGPVKGKGYINGPYATRREAVWSALALCEEESESA